MLKMKIGDGPEEIEVGQFKLINKGSLRARFSLCLYPRGQKILECTYFVSGENRWFNLPQKEIKFQDGKKSDYIPLVSFADKEFFEKFKITVLTILQSMENPNETNFSGTNKNARTQVQTDPSTDREGLPF